MQKNNAGLKNKKRVSKKMLWYLLLIPVAIIMTFPFFWLLSSSLKLERNIFTLPPQLIPWPITFENYINVIRESKFLNWFFNSLYITLIVVFFGTLVSSMAGFAYAKLRFRGRSLLFMLPLCAIMIPNEVILLPMFRMWSWVGAIDSHLPLILPNIVGVGGMFGVFLFRQFYLSIPTEICEAASIDGCSPLGTFFRIMLPNSQSQIVCLAIFNFSATWNDYLNPLIYLNSSEKYTLALGLGLFSDMTGVMWGQLMAACVMATLPIVIVFFFAQNQFIESVVLSGVKG